MPSSESNKSISDMFLFINKYILKLKIVFEILALGKWVK